jgi:radical SAM protein with 4Fe4S-binding SPASM domain
MVSPVKRFLRKLWDSLRRDLSGFVAAFGRAAQPEPGLYTYRVTPRGGTRRLHLRIEANGEGTLFVDAMDVIHLNETAARIAKMALDDIAMSQAESIMRRAYRRPSRRQIGDEVERIYRMVEHLSTSPSGCPTCALADLQRRAAFSTRARAPYKADLAITYGCNNSCSHCYNEPDRLDMPSLSRTDWFRVLDKLAGVGIPHVIFTGGEATLHPDLPDLIRHADSLGQITGLNTNGRRIAHRDYMRTLADAGLNHIQVTLASHVPELHNAVNGANAFDQTVRGIENALESGVHAITNTTLMRANRDLVEPFIEFLYALGIRTFAMNGMIYSGGGFADPNAIPEEEMAPLLALVRDKADELGMRFLWYTPTEYCRMSPVELEIGAKRCNAGEYSICVEPNGDVLPCQSFYTSAGNVLTDPWEMIWHGELFRSFRDREDDPRWAGLPEKCWECPDLPLCGGGCRIDREAREGRRTAEEPHAGCGGCGKSGGERFIPSGGLIDATVRARGNGLLTLPLIGQASFAGECCGTTRGGKGCGCGH